MEERYVETFRPWAESPVGGAFEFIGVFDDGRELIVKVGGQKHHKLIFHDVVGHRTIDEGTRIVQHALLDAGAPQLVYEVEPSVFLGELVRLSQGALSEDGLTHYLVWTLNECVDVVCAQAPKIV